MRRALSRSGYSSRKMAHVVGQPIFERPARLLGREDWLRDPRFASDLLRGDNRESYWQKYATCPGREAAT